MFRFELANLDFKVIEITERLTAERIEYRKDKLRFLCDDFDCTLQQADGYDDTIKKIDDGKGWAVTATLTVRSVMNQSLDENATDDFADAVCELLSFAKKNTVYWIQRTRFSEAGAV